MGGCLVIDKLSVRGFSCSEINIINGICLGGKSSASALGHRGQLTISLSASLPTLTFYFLSFSFSPNPILFLHFLGLIVSMQAGFVRIGSDFNKDYANFVSNRKFEKLLFDGKSRWKREFNWVWQRFFQSSSSARGIRVSARTTGRIPQCEKTIARVFARTWANLMERILAVVCLNCFEESEGLPTAPFEQTIGNQDKEMESSPIQTKA